MVINVKRSLFPYKEGFESSSVPYVFLIVSLGFIYNFSLSQNNCLPQANKVSLGQRGKETLVEVQIVPVNSTLVNHQIKTSSTCLNG